MIKQIYPPNWAELREACIERAGRKCEMCGVKEGRIKTSKRSKRRYIVYLHAAHLDNSDPGSNEPNLIALCPSCHMKLDREVEKAERVTQRRRGYSITTTDNLLEELQAVGLTIQEQSDGYYWQVDGKTGQATTAVGAVAQAIFYLRMAALDKAGEWE